MAETFNYTREWTDEKAFPLLGFSRDWNNPEDYPTVELDERKVRADMQSLHDEVKNYLNEQLIPAVIAEEATVEDWAHAESLRTEAENGRASAEEDRTSAEAARVLAEQGRADAEAARAAAEQARVDSTTGIVAQAAEQAQAAGVSAQASENSAERAGQSASGAAASQESAALHDANAKAWSVGGSVGEETDKGVFYTMVDGAQYYSELAKMYAAGGAKPDGVEPSDGIRHDGAANLAQKAAAFAHGGSYKTYDMYGNLNTVTVPKGAKQYAADAEAAQGAAEAARDAAQAATANTATKDLSNVSDADFLAKAEAAGVGPDSILAEKTEALKNNTVILDGSESVDIDLSEVTGIAGDGLIRVADLFDEDPMGDTSKVSYEVKVIFGGSVDGGFTAPQGQYAGFDETGYPAVILCQFNSNCRLEGVMYFVYKDGAVLDNQSGIGGLNGITFPRKGIYLRAFAAYDADMPESPYVTSQTFAFSGVEMTVSREKIKDSYLPAADTDVFIAQYGVTKNAEIEAAYMARKCVLCETSVALLSLVLRRRSTDHIFAVALNDVCMEVEVKNDIWTTSTYEGYVPASHASTHAPGGSDPLYTAGTDDLTAGSSALETGKLYFVYE